MYGYGIRDITSKECKKKYIVNYIKPKWHSKRILFPNENGKFHKFSRVPLDIIWLVQYLAEVLVGEDWRTYHNTICKSIFCEWYQYEMVRNTGTEKNLLG